MRNAPSEYMGKNKKTKLEYVYVLVQVPKDACPDLIGALEDYRDRTRNEFTILETADEDPRPFMRQYPAQ